MHNNGDWETVYDPDAPMVEDVTTTQPREKPFRFYVRANAFYLRANEKNYKARQLCKITLPHSWSAATIGRLVELLAKKADPPLPAWDCHLIGQRGPLGHGLAITAALVRREIVELARGPPPLSSERARNRRSMWVWGRLVDGSLHSSPCRQIGLGRHEVSKLALGDEHVLALTAVGLVLSWGRNDSGQCGTGDEKTRIAPAVIRALAVNRCVEVAFLNPLVAPDYGGEPAKDRDEAMTESSADDTVF